MNTAIRYFQGIVLLLGLATSAFVLGANSNDYSGANLTGINHTQSGITSFRVNGYGGRVGGNTCCVMLADHWRPGMQVNIEWKTDPGTSSKFPGYQDPEKYKAWEKEVNNSYVQHVATVEIPKYDKPCALVVHFLTCNRIKVTAACAVYGQPNYPIKEPLHMKEPVSCQK